MVSPRRAGGAILIALLATASAAAAAVGDPVVIDVPGMHMQGLSPATQQAEEQAAAAAAQQAAEQREQRLDERPVIDVPGMHMEGLSPATQQAEEAAAAAAAQSAAQERESRLNRHITINVAGMRMTGIATPPTPSPPRAAPIMPHPPPASTAPALPDLTVTALTLDRHCHVLVHLANRGGAVPAAAYGRRGALLTLSAGKGRGRWRLAAIDPRRRLQRPGGKLTWRWPTAIHGTVRTIAVIDANRRLRESSEGNNRLARKLTCRSLSPGAPTAPLRAPLKH